MKIVLQRVKKAWVDVKGERVGEIGHGVLLLVGLGKLDKEDDVNSYAERIAKLRIFEDLKGKMNLSLNDIKGDALVISQFTLYGNLKKGLRPSFEKALEPKAAFRLYRLFVEQLKKYVDNVQEGIFGEYMQVGLINDGPVTFILGDENE